MDEHSQENTLALPSPEATLLEIAEFFDVHPELMRPEYLNNFHTLATGSNMREYLAQFPKTAKIKERLHDDFDSAVVEAGLDTDIVRSLAAQIKAAKYDFGRYYDLVIQMSTLTLPVYKLLRQKGYTTMELIQ